MGINLDDVDYVRIIAVMAIFVVSGILTYTWGLNNGRNKNTRVEIFNLSCVAKCNFEDIALKNSLNSFIDNTISEIYSDFSVSMSRPKIVWYYEENQGSTALSVGNNIFINVGFKYADNKIFSHEIFHVFQGNFCRTANLSILESVAAKWNGDSIDCSAEEQQVYCLLINNDRNKFMSCMRDACSVDKIFSNEEFEHCKENSKGVVQFRNGLIVN